METTESLEPLTFFHSLEPQDRELLAAIATRRSYPAGTTIFSEGESHGSFRVLESGLVSLRQKHRDHPGDSQMTSIGKPGAPFGISALVGELHLYPHSAVCLEDTEVVEIEDEQLLETLHANPEAGVRILLRFAQFLAAELSAAREQIRSRIRPGLISHG